MADDIITTYTTPPVYSIAKSATLTPTFEVKSFKSYQRTVPEDGHITTDDVDDGGFTNEDGA